MATHSEADLQFQIGHVLFIDIAGYSRLLINEQSELIRQLKEVVRGTEQFRLAEAEGKLLRLPTGDGGALVFRNTQEAPVLCALEISKALKNHPELQVRMGVHSGPVNEVADLNEQMNVAGAGINIAQRVMDCGDAGHILLSKHVAEDLEDYARWRPYLHELGECETKHSGIISVVNLYDDEVGNPQLPEKLKEAQRERAAKAAASRPAPTFRRKRLLIGVGFLLIAAIGIGFWIYSRQATVTPSGKSIAVLPFENLSEDKANAYFADGIQEEILTRLAKIGDLKVIARTSTQLYQSKPANLSEIAKQLGVANILEGSVQRSADQVRVNVQLIKAATGAHLWADTFDRKLTDIFAVESDIAKTIADTLQAKLTRSEEHAIAARPTENSEAHQLYLKGRFFWNKRTGNDLKKSIDYFNQAIEADPNYALAYAGVADAYVLLPTYTAGTPRESYPKAEAAAKKALELDDKLAEAHTSLALAIWLYDFDFSQATREFQRAIELNPNYAAAHQQYGNNTLSALGRFDDAIVEGKQAVELDPLSLIINTDLGTNYLYARRYDEAIAQLRKTLEMTPGFYYAYLYLGQALEMKGARDTAIAEYQRARALNDDPAVLGLLAHVYGLSGNKTEALKILDQLKELSNQRYVSAYSFALVYLGLGDKEEALRWLEKSYQDRAGSDIGYIRVDPLLDPLRGDPRFEALAEKILRRGAK
jgi:TolB-like protein/class 3 adenylate cyclase/Flp pilus assembly protein TadD